MTINELLNKAKKDKKNDLESNLEILNEIFESHFEEYREMIRQLNLFDRKHAMLKLLKIYKIEDISSANLLDKVEGECLSDEDWVKIEQSIAQGLKEKYNKGQ